ncbi:hypothetical protein CRV24_008629 [Beauveria bassiana]|nr:hypothetical protein CRV24_008629 [Beauveria bassiana]
MAQPATASKPRGFSRFSKALPSVPQLLRPSSNSSSAWSSTSPRSASHQLSPLPPPPKDLPNPPPPPKDLPDLPPLPKNLPDLPPPPHEDASHAHAVPPQSFDKSPSLPSIPGAFPSEHTPAASPQKMSIPRRPVGGTNNVILSPFPEPSPTASISSLISAYSRPYETPTTTPHTAVYPDTPLASSREASPPPDAPAVPDKTPVGATNHNRLHASPSNASLTDRDEAPDPPSKPEIWRRRPLNDNREISELKLDHSHGSTISSAMSSMSASTTSTQRPPTALQDESSQSQPAKTRKPPSTGGLPGRNVRPSAAPEDDAPSSTTSAQLTINPLLSKQSLPSLPETAATPPTNRPPTPEYQNGESRAAVVTTFTSPASPASSPESANSSLPECAQELPPPPPRNPNRNAPSSTVTKLGPVTSTSTLTEMLRRKPVTSASFATAPLPTSEVSSATALLPTSEVSSATAPLPTSVVSPAVAPSPVNGDPFANKSELLSATGPSFPSDSRRANTPVSASAPSGQSRGASSSPTRRFRRDPDQTPRQQRRPASDPRIVQTEQGPMYRGRDGTLYPEMKNLREPDPRAFHFPTWKGKETTTTSFDGVHAAPALNDSHHSCFQKHAIMHRRTNRHYPLTCQTCSKANADDRWACTFCHLRICESCFRTFDTNQRDLKKLVATIDGRTPLSLSSDARSASAFGL